MSDPATQSITQRGRMIRDDNNVPTGYLYTNITTTTSTTVKSGAGFLHSITINTPIASSVIKIYDNTTNSGTLIGTITIPATLLEQGPYTALYDVTFNTGLTINTATGASDITIASV